MQFIKSLWNKVKSFFSGLFGSKKVDTKAVQVTKATIAQTEQKEVQAEAQEVATQEAQAANDVKMEKLAELFSRVVELHKARSYTLDEAKAAFFAHDEVALERIAREMKAKTYKAPKASKIAKLYKAAAVAA